MLTELQIKEINDYHSMNWSSQNAIRESVDEVVKIRGGATKEQIKREGDRTGRLEVFMACLSAELLGINWRDLAIFQGQYGNEKTPPRPREEN